MSSYRSYEQSTGDHKGGAPDSGHMAENDWKMKIDKKARKVEIQGLGRLWEPLEGDGCHYQNIEKPKNMEDMEKKRVGNRRKKVELMLEDRSN